MATSLDRSALQALRREHQQRKRALLDAFVARRRSLLAAANLYTSLAKLADESLLNIWHALDQRPENLSLVAVGGYGRSELSPGSDIDVIVLTSEDAPGSATRAWIERFVGASWDAGLEIGSSVRSVAQCVSDAASDIATQTALLEARALTHEAHFATLMRAFWQSLNPRTFMEGKLSEMTERHRRFNDTAFALEPNCKESPGGLRDLQIILWLTKAAQMGGDWDALVRNELATPLEAAALKDCEAWLRLIRAHLHIAAARREDRLLFDLQAALAHSLGFRQGEATRASEALMRRYYRAAKAVTQLNQILLLNLKARLFPEALGQPQRLDDDFSLRGGLLEVADASVFVQRNDTVMRAFCHYQQTQGVSGFSVQTLRALYHAQPHLGARWRADARNHHLFLSILHHWHGHTHVLRLMNQTGVLGRYLRPFAGIVGRMQHDLFHVYTVDQHTLLVLRNIRRFFIPEHAHEYPLCSRLALHFPRPWLLYLGALFHDIAKGRRSDHSLLGEREVRRFCKSHGVNEADSDFAAFLVREHLTLSRIAQKEDLDDPTVIRNFATLVQTEERLTALYLLTVADVRGTSPKVWNTWKARLLEDLFRQTRRALGGSTWDTHSQIEERQEAAQRLLERFARRTAEPIAQPTPLWESVGLAYFLRHDAPTIAWHALHIAPALSAIALGAAFAPMVHARRARGDATHLQVFIFTPDQPALFARLCSFFDAQRLDILDARIHTAENGAALDTFIIAAPDHAQINALLLQSVETGLVQMLQASQTQPAMPLPAPRSARISRRARHFPVPVTVSLNPDESATNWLLHITASDRAGLLYGIARTFAAHKVNLQLAKITTLGERAEDVFLIRGTALADEKARAQLEADLRAALAAPA